MQFTFEFDAPRSCLLELTLDKNKESDYSLKNSDQNDFWFMHTCEKNYSQNTFGRTDLNQTQQDPVLRRSIAQQQIPIAETTQDQPILNQNEINIQRNEEKQVQFADENQRRINEKKPAKTRRIAFRKTEIQQNKKRAVSKHRSADKQQKPAHNKETTRSKSNLPKINLNDLRPCPFPPRIQREWESKFEKKWYTLSPPSKLHAQKQMKQIQVQKINRQKANVAKQNPFLRKEVGKKKK